MDYQTIDEERGARKAAELRHRFSRVTSASLGRPGLGSRVSTGMRRPLAATSRRAYPRDVLVWCFMAAIVGFFAFVML